MVELSHDVRNWQEYLIIVVVHLVECQNMWVVNDIILRDSSIIIYTLKYFSVLTSLTRKYYCIIQRIKFTKHMTIFNILHFFTLTRKYYCMIERIKIIGHMDSYRSYGCYMSDYFVVIIW